MAQKSEGAKYVLTSDMDAVAPAAGIAAKAYGHTLHLDPQWIKRTYGAGLLGNHDARVLYRVFPSGHKLAPW